MSLIQRDRNPQQSILKYVKINVTYTELRIFKIISKLNVICNFLTDRKLVTHFYFEMYIFHGSPLKENCPFAVPKIKYTLREYQEGTR